MTDYIKTEQLFGPKDEATIQVTTKDGVEVFSLWDDKEKKMYKENEQLEIDGKTYTVNKYIKLTEEQKNRYRRNLKIEREIVVDGKPYTYNMPPSIDKKLLTVMGTIESMDKNPLAFSYKIIRKKKGNTPKDVEYDVNLGTEAKDAPELELRLDGEEEDVELDESEKKMVEAVKKKYPNYASIPEDKIADAFKKTLKTADYRAKLIVEKYLR